MAGFDPNQNFNKPSSHLPDDSDKPIPFDNAGIGAASVSHVPLNLGGGAVAKAPEPAVKKPVEKITSSPDRITGVKTFFTKLHPGALEFLDEQINLWLKENPGLKIKSTNVVTGEVQGKKTEPNLIITVWY